MTRDEFLTRYQDTIWQGGARYWRGQIMYRPTWAIRDLVHERPSGYWLGGLPPKVWLIVIERLDDNAASQPRGTRQRISLQCFEPWENYPGGAWLRPLTGVRAKAAA